MIGCAKIISEKSPLFYEDWIKEIGRNFKLLLDSSENILSLTNDGERITLTTTQAREILIKELQLYVKFVNRFGNTITCTVTIIDNYLVIEDYSMDELINDDDEEDLKVFLKKRFEQLLNDKIGIGFIFDTRGYSEDYLLTAPPDWRKDENCSKLMRG